MKRLSKYTVVFLRIALGVTFLSAVADRFGMLGSLGQPNVAWGDFGNFEAYTARLNWFLPSGLIPALAWLVTCLETILGFTLIAGLFTRISALASGTLLLLFALAMTASTGLQSALAHSVYSASAGAFLLAASERYMWSLDSLRKAHFGNLEADAGARSVEK
ncbi:MAG: DoxX family membrane protein [Chloracidobacterium sp.]|nr:DoxX family membrane protein [Chloracidobacterium sp.]